MKTFGLPKTGYFYYAVAVACVIAGLLVGCGMDMSAGVGTGGTGTVRVASVSLSGIAADGYLINAVVFLDRNGNYQWDADEPFAVTAVDGSYKLEVLSTDLGQYPIVVQAIKGVTIDSDTYQPLAHSYILSMPKEGVSSTGINFISPISSQLREMMETGAYATLQDAAEVLRKKMQLPAGTNLLSNYVANADTTIHGVARTIADLMGQQMDKYMTTEKEAVDVVRYRAMMTVIGSNLTILMYHNTQQNLMNLADSINIILSKIPSHLDGQSVGGAD